MKDPRETDPFTVAVEVRPGPDGEEPVALELGEERRAVDGVLDRWDDVRRSGDGAVRRIFKVRLDDQSIVLLEQDRGTRAWTLRGWGVGRR